MSKTPDICALCGGSYFRYHDTNCLCGNGLSSTDIHFKGVNRLWLRWARFRYKHLIPLWTAIDQKVSGWLFKEIYVSYRWRM